MNLSRNFTLSELTKSDTAIRKGINNNPNAEQIEKIKTVNIVNIERDMAVLTDGVNTIIAKLERAEGTWEMAENLYEVLADRVRQMEYDIKDLNREINY